MTSLESVQEANKGVIPMIMTLICSLILVLPTVSEPSFVLFRPTQDSDNFNTFAPHMKELLQSIDTARLPRHIALIMDGNGRWAKKTGRPRIFGHENGIEAVRSVTEASAKLGIEHLTLYAFSTENWDRPEQEVNALMELLVRTIKKETETLTKNNIRLNAIGNVTALPESCFAELKESIRLTENNDGMTLTLALNYSGRWDIANAMQQIGFEVQAGSVKAHEINPEFVQNYISNATAPDPELLIRTSGEKRISNFLLWQMAYTELYFTNTLWPDFRERHLYEAIIDFQGRERRFGKTSEQIKVT